MDKEILELIDEAVELEMNIGRLYSLFSRRCPEDKSFWLQLEMEEYNHAALLKTGKKFVAYSKFPLDLIPEKIEHVRNSNRLIKENHKKFERNPDRFTAFSVAYELENTAGELHYQQFMESGNQDDLRDIFRKLNRADNDHSKRILKYWTEANQESNRG